VEAQLVDGDAQILHLVEGEAETTGQAGGREPHEPEILGRRGHHKPHVTARAQSFLALALILAVAQHLPAPRGPVQDHGRCSSH